MDYTPLEKIAEGLLAKINSLKSGQMKPEEVSDLVESARNVYERLVVLEFQAHEKNNASKKETELKTFKIETEEPLNQISIIDAIEEASTTQEEKENLKSVSNQIKIDIPDPVPLIEEKEVEKPIEKVEEVLEEEAAEKEAIVIPESTEPETDESETLAEKFENAPIEDIAKSISLNEKFQFIRVLCGNNSKAFEMLLEQINKCPDEGSALKMFGSSIPLPEAEDDKAVYEKFQELIKRKF